MVCCQLWYQRLPKGVLTKMTDGLVRGILIVDGNMIDGTGTISG
jgi:hypothetical protein